MGNNAKFNGEKVANSFHHSWHLGLQCGIVAYICCPCPSAESETS